MRLCFPIKGFNCAGRGRNLWHCAGVASVVRTVKETRSMRLGDDRLGRGTGA